MIADILASPWRPILAMLGAFVCTLAIELAVAALLGYRKRLELAAVVCVNVITNLPLNYALLTLCGPSGGLPESLSPVSPLVLGCELSVTLVEWLLLVYALRSSWARLLLLSALMNAASYIVGVGYSWFQGLVRLGGS